MKRTSLFPSIAAAVVLCAYAAFATTPNGDESAFNPAPGAFAVPPAVIADDDPCWSYFTPLGNSISVSFCKVKNASRDEEGDTWTWKFRNDGYDTISYLEYTYTEYHIDYTNEEHNDYFPGTLGPGKIFGGWAAFTAESTRSPTLRIKKIERR